MNSTLCWLEIFKGRCRALFNMFRSTNSELAFLGYLLEVSLEIMPVLELKVEKHSL